MRTIVAGDHLATLPILAICTRRQFQLIRSGMVWLRAIVGSSWVRLRHRTFSHMADTKVEILPFNHAKSDFFNPNYGRDWDNASPLCP